MSYNFATHLQQRVQRISSHVMLSTDQLLNVIKRYLAEQTTYPIAGEADYEKHSISELSAKDAYEAGMRDGVTLLARQLLSMLNQDGAVRHARKLINLRKGQS